MSGSGGNSAINQGIDFITNYNPETGKFGDSGSTLGWLNSGIGELTGANQEKAALNEETNQFNTTQAEAQQLVANQQQQQQAQNVQASNTAAAARSAATATFSQATYANSTPLVWGNSSPLGSDQRTFLGV